jgi:hypothetical protein
MSERQTIPASIRHLPEQWRAGGRILRRAGDADGADRADAYAEQLDICIRAFDSSAPPADPEAGTDTGIKR